MSEVPIDLDSEIAALYRGPLHTFVQDRNALAKDLQAAKRRDEAKQVKSLAKPNLVGWVLNQLHWRYPDEIQALLELGDQLREMQAGQLSREAGRPLPRERTAQLSRLLTKAEELLQEDGHASASDTQRKLAASLDALSSWGTQYDGQLGRLAGAIDPPKLEDLLNLTGVAPRIRSTPPEPKTADLERERRIRELQETRSALEGKKSKLESDLDLSEDNRIKAATEAALARQQLRQAQEKLQDLEGSILEKKRVLASLRSELQQLEAKLARLS